MGTRSLYLSLPPSLPSSYIANLVYLPIRELPSNNTSLSHPVHGPASLLPHFLFLLRNNSPRAASRPQTSSNVKNAPSFNLLTTVYACSTSASLTIPVMIPLGFTAVSPSLLLPTLDLHVYDSMNLQHR
jgi:hypothetical protein